MCIRDSIEGLVHRECLVVDALVIPLAALVEQVHLLRVHVGVNHVEVEAVVLLAEAFPRGRVVVVLCDRNELLDRHIDLGDAAELQRVELQEIGVREELETEHKPLSLEALQ